MSRAPRGAARCLALLLSGILAAACAGGPEAPQTPPPETTPTPATTPAVTEPSPEEGTTVPTPEPGETEGVSVALVPPEETQTQTETGTPIVLPTPRERALQTALAETRALVAAGDADSLRRALERLVRTEGTIAGSEAITQPEGAALAATALAGFRAQAPERLPELIPTLTRAHELAPPTADSLSALGRAAYTAGQYDLAERSAATGLTMDPLRIDLYLLRAQILAATDRWVQARTPLETVLRVEPENADALLLEATIRWRFERDIQGATELIQDAFATHPDDTRFLELQGYILHDQGQLEQARLVLGPLLEREPGRVAVRRFLLHDAVERAAWTDAVAMLEGLGGLTTAEDLELATEVYGGMGDHARAVESATRLDALEKDRRWSPVLTRALVASGNREAALAVITSALAVSRDKVVRSDLLYLRAVAAGEPYTEDAVRDLQRALSENPANADAMMAMARHFHSTSQPAKALQYARSALRYRPDDPAVLELLRLIDTTAGGATTP